MIQRFGQAELADDIGISRASFSNFEYGAARVTFAAGFAFCRRLDLSPRWLASGEEPKRPFVELAELGLSEDAVKAHCRRGVDYLTGYNAVLSAPLDAWIEKLSDEALIRRQIEGGPEALARRMSMDQLEALAAENVVALKNEDLPWLKLARIETAEVMLRELRIRLAPNDPRTKRVIRKR
jgi:transcriptional regulator with XRE-family HTH domain